MTDEMRNLEELAEELEFAAELNPQKSDAGAPARVTVENQGSVEQLFTLTWRSLDDELGFEPHAIQQLHIPPREVAMARFSAKPRSSPLFGGARILPFTTQVQAASGRIQNLNGEIVGKALIPTWVPVVVLALLLACACLTVTGVGVLGFLDRAQTEAPAATAPPGAEQPTEAPAAEQPPAEQPTEPPPEQPAKPPQEQPAEPPPEQPAEPPQEQPTEPPQEQPAEPPSASQLPAEEGSSGLPCVPLAGGLVLAPLLVIGSKGGNRRSSIK